MLLIIWWLIVFPVIVAFILGFLAKFFRQLEKIYSSPSE